MRFFHFADYHLGAQFDTRAMAVRKRLREAQRLALQDMIRRAIDLNIDAVLIAGDLIDSTSIDPRNEIFLQQEMARLAEAQIPVYMVYGNHDASLQLNLPGVKIIQDVLEVIETEKFRIVGQSFRAASDMREIKDLPRFSDGLPTIGLFHTMVQQNAASASLSQYLPVQLSHLEETGYHYIALGHIHLRQALSKSCPIHYVGSFFPTNRSELGEKGYHDVVLGAGLKVNFVPSSKLYFTHSDIALESGEDFRSRTYSQLRPLARSEQLQRITLHGALRATEISDLGDILEMIDEESSLPIEWSDKTHLIENFDIANNPFFEELMQCFEPELLKTLEEAKLQSIRTEDYLAWYLENKDKVHRMFLSSFFEGSRK